MSFKLSLLILSLIIWVSFSTLTDYECPATTTALGPVGTRFDNSVRDLFSERFDPTQTIDDCEALCRSPEFPQCVAFEFSLSCSWFSTYNQCSLYSVVGPVNLPSTSSYSKRYYRYRSYDKAGSCAINLDQFCPSGTIQIEENGIALGIWPGIGAVTNPAFRVFTVAFPPEVDFGNGDTVDDTLTLQECNLECCGDADCAGFSYLDTMFDLGMGLEQITICIGWTDMADLDSTMDLDPVNNIFARLFTCELEVDGCNTLDCPAGSTEIGRGVEFGVNGRPVSPSLFYKTVEECAEECRCDEDCFFFTYDDDVGNGISICTLFEYGETGDPFDPSSVFAELITCEIESCPDGTTQIGSTGDALEPDNGITFIRGLTIQECKAECEAEPLCQAFTFDFDVYSGWYYKVKALYDKTADNGCWLFDSPDIANQPVQLSARDAISCAVSGGTSAKSSPFINFEPISNEPIYQSYHISAYIVYGVIGLAILNIICLTINCCKKKGRKGKQYRVVSVRSDDDSTDA